MEKLPLVKSVSDVGTTPFQFVSKQETILQGFHTGLRRSVYLFRTPDKQWGYYESATKKVVRPSAWDGKSAFIDGAWIKLGLYHRVHLRVPEGLVYNTKSGPKTVQDFIIPITDSAYKALESQTQGRPLDSFYQFEMKKLANNRVYVGSVKWVR